MLSGQQCGATSAPAAVGRCLSLPAQVFQPRSLGSLCESSSSVVAKGNRQRVNTATVYISAAQRIPLSTPHLVPTLSKLLILMSCVMCPALPEGTLELDGGSICIWNTCTWREGSGTANSIGGRVNVLRQRVNASEEWRTTVVTYKSHTSHMQVTCKSHASHMQVTCRSHAYLWHSRLEEEV